MSNQVVTREAVPQVDRSIKDYSLIRKVTGAYDPAEVATLISPKETMGGDNYIWVEASTAEAIIAASADRRRVVWRRSNARLRHIAGTAWSTKRYLNIRAAKGSADERCYHRLSQCRAPLSPTKCAKNLWTLPNFAFRR